MGQFPIFRRVLVAFRHFVFFGKMIGSTVVQLMKLLYSSLCSKYIHLQLTLWIRRLVFNENRFVAVLNVYIFVMVGVFKYVLTSSNNIPDFFIKDVPFI